MTLKLLLKFIAFLFLVYVGVFHGVPSPEELKVAMEYHGLIIPEEK